MEISQCYCLGRVTKPWGTKGQMAIYLDVDTPADYAALQSAFVEMKGRLVPLFFSIDQLNGNRAIATFEDMTPDETARLAGHELYLPLDMLPKLDGNRFYFHEVVGFSVVDSQRGPIGKITQVLEYPAQPVFQIDNDGTEVLVPVVDEVIDRLDRDTHTMYITAPNGLIDLYMGEINR
ncbi:MAG: 16S rRNA processing protein RimM [Bacteroidales bacterium]|nr:16S rRNA processing protein RimM [Bacteroidales bacterium]